MNKLLHYGLMLIFILCGIATYAQQPTLEWAERYDGKGSLAEYSVAIAVDAAGNSYVTGTSSNANFGFPKRSVVTVKYSPEGDTLWTSTFKDDEDVAVAAIAVDNQGGVYITGSTYNSQTGSNYFTVRYDAASGAKVWTETYGGEDYSDNRATAIAVDGQGSVYVTGVSYSWATNYDYVTIRYDAVTGDEKWTKPYNGGGDNPTEDQARAIAVDNHGNVYVTGISYGETDYFNADYATVSYDAVTGNKRWDNRYNGKGNGYDEARAIAVDNLGGVYVTGTSYSETTSNDIVTIRLNATDGHLVWDAPYYSEDGSYSEDQAADITVDNQGRVFVAGTSYSTTTGYGFAVIAYEAASGAHSWTSPYREEGSDSNFARAIAVDNAGGVFVTGNSFAWPDGHSTVTVRFDATSGDYNWSASYKQADSRENIPTAMAVSSGGVYVTGYSNNSDTSYDYVTLRYEATDGAQSWLNLFNVEGSRDDAPIAVTADAEGNSYVTGTSRHNQLYLSKTSIVTIKYSPSGDSLWVRTYESKLGVEARAIAVDNKGGVYVTGYEENGDSRRDYLTIRYDAATGDERWVRHYNSESHLNGEAVAIAVDNQGGVYVTGTSRGWASNDYVTIRYDAATGDLLWDTPSDIDSERYSDDQARAIAVDNKGGVYVTGTSYGGETFTDFVTIRFDAANGTPTWVSPYNMEGVSASFDYATAIAVDSTGGVYVTGTSYDALNVTDAYSTIRYAAETGDLEWFNHYNGPAGGLDVPTAITVDNQGSVYVTGRSEGGTESNATVRYDAVTGDEKWAVRFSSESQSLSEVVAIAADNEGGVYISGSGFNLATGSRGFSTVKFNTKDGALLWQTYTEGPSDVAVDMTLDRFGNVFVTGYSFSSNTANDFLTVKYSQIGSCPTPSEAPILGDATVAVTSKVTYSLAVPEATSFFWEITTPNGSSFTSFTGQGTSSISVDWPGQPEFYKVSVTYSAGEGCPTTTSVNYIHVFDPKAGFVTGAGWSTSPVSPSLELMQQEGRAHWAFGARYKEKAGEIAQGSLLLVLENGYVFRATSVTDGSLVIADDRAYFTGTGSLTQTGSGGFATDPRRFAYLISAVDGDLKNGNGKRNREKDRLRLVIWTLQEDGSRGDVLYDNQLSCPSSELQLNAVACQEIERGSIVIHRKDIKSVSDLFATAAGEPAAQGMQAYPTVFQERTSIAFTLEQPSGYSLDLYDLKGALVRQIATGDAENGRRYEYEVRAAGLSEGLYFARLTTDQGVQTVKIVVQR